MTERAACYFYVTLQEDVLKTAAVAQFVELTESSVTLENILRAAKWLFLRSIGTKTLGHVGCYSKFKCVKK